MRIVIIMLVFFAISKNAFAQKYGAQSNLLAFSTLSINAGGEMSISDKWTVSGNIYYNPLRVAQFVAFQPAVNYYFLTSFYKWFVFCGTTHSYFNFASDRTYNGWMNGVGVGVGYSIPIKTNMNLIVSTGLGVYNANYKDFQTNIDHTVDEIIYHRNEWLLLPSKCEITFQILF